VNTMKPLCLLAFLACIGCTAQHDLGSHPQDVDAGDAAPDPGRKRVFVTSTTYLGDLVVQVRAASGPAAADTLCTKAAEAATLGGHAWKAYLSDDSVDAIDRIQDVSPWYSVDRRTLHFANKAALSTQPRTSVEQTEYGQIPSTMDPNVVWTGTSSSGRRSTGAKANCANWTSREFDVAYEDYGTAGVDYNVNQWQESDALECNRDARLYCFEQ
jgi:hypothetical protein